MALIANSIIFGLCLRCDAGRFSHDRVEKSDIERIYDYTVNSWSISQADAFYAEIIATFEGLVSGAKIGTALPLKAIRP
jgi:hypothetical protein